MADNFSTSIRDLQNLPEIQEPIQYETNKGRLDMDTEIHQAINMASKINKKLEDYKENNIPEMNDDVRQYVQPDCSFKGLDSLKDFSNKNDLITVLVLIVIVFSPQLNELVSKYIPFFEESNNITIIITKAILVTVIYHIIKKLLL